MTTILDSHIKNIEKLQKLVDQGGIETEKINEINKIEYIGPVYDLTIRTSNSYILNRIASSNSAGGSLACYALGIHSMDPLKWGLSFDRFLSASRGGNMLNIRME